ncbi:SGNH/GDSL hydrolase family protein [Rhizosphaericola mali]|uniref:Acylhydrolase n=1 Tax=Rhizosphaericola mali TaxID=2545455 RepID=A0A5P2G6Y9_9BACT|nr:SGNH/GDSL hydrolase family protein [Rhizosphaericola mali]QES89540.1 acylhydrolase [Rhizosphaericola mali]
MVRKWLFVATITLVGKLNAQTEKDWAQFNKYEKSNDLVKILPQRERNVVFMGNSITEGWYRFDSSFFIENKYIDRGISGQTTSQMLVRFRKDVIDLHPSYVVILSGTNDIAQNQGFISLENILGNIVSMCELAEAHKIKPIICSVLPAYDYPWRKGLSPNEKIPALNKMLEAYAKEKKFTYVNYFPKMADDKNGMQTKLTYDGVHPNKEGYIIMEKVLLPILKKLR